MGENLIPNFHTHTSLCHHAEGSPIDYARRAKADGCSTLGFSDHCPYPDGSEDSWSGTRMAESEAALYIADARRAGIEAGVNVLAGFECEWDPSYDSWYRDALLGEAGADYLAFGPHWAALGGVHAYVIDLESKADFREYIRQTADGITRGPYSFVAHPDLFMAKWREWDDDAKAFSREIIGAAVARGIPLEVNGLGMRRGLMPTRRGERYGYPYEEFWRMAVEMGAKAVCDSDAHSPAAVIADARAARSFAQKIGVEICGSIAVFRARCVD